VNIQQLQALAAQGESALLEFKTSTSSLRDAMQTVCAMRNGYGGHVLIGVKDSGTIVGQDLTTRTLEEIANELRKFDPPIFPDIERVALDTGKQVIVFNVPSGGGRGPYAYDGRCFQRIGPTTSIMPEYEREQLTMERLHGTRRWENEPVAPGVSIADLDAPEIQRVVEAGMRLQRIPRIDASDTEGALRGLKLIADDTLLNAAVALFGASDRLQPFYPQLSIRMARFRGIDRLADFADNRQPWCHAFEQLRRAESFLADHVPIAGRVHPDRFIREDRPRYAPRATREALANAICHRDYTAGGGAVTVAMYDDRLEIANPGSLHFGLTPEKLHRPHESHPWNPLIASVFFLAGVIEKWGTGTLNIIEWCREIGAAPPVWQDQAGSVMVTFFPAAPIGVPNVGRGEQRSLELRVLQALVDGPLSRTELAQRLGQKRPSGPLQSMVRELVNAGILEYAIPDKPTSPFQRYQLTDHGRSRLS
jgi:ATP-dependent DNA helicase RecG